NCHIYSSDLGYLPNKSLHYVLNKLDHQNHGKLQHKLNPFGDLKHPDSCLKHLHAQTAMWSKMIYCASMWSKMIYCASMWSKMIYCASMWSKMIYCGFMFRKQIQINGLTKTVTKTTLPNYGANWLELTEGTNK
ncbi:hypothetical protein ACJX0J_021648, partial [Zea mays]